MAARVKFSTRGLAPFGLFGTNRACWKEAKRYLVGGVNSPVRSFQAVGGVPIFVDRGQGPTLWDVEGRRYIDYICSWGALILGHRHPAVLQAVTEALERGTTFGTPTASETALAKEITRALPSMEQVRFVSSGTEAVMSALRLARAVTGRSKVLKFEGAYHGHVDALLSAAGSGMATLGIPTSPGVPQHVAQDTLTIPFNDLAALEKVIRRYRGEIACAMAEPILANVGVIPPKAGFLSRLRELTRRERILLIFDEVITGFRVAYGGAQAFFHIAPDLTILGKVIGGGFPVGAYGGSRKLMQRIAPSGPVYQAGTLSGHPVAMAAGLATLSLLGGKDSSNHADIYGLLEKRAKRLRAGLLESARRQKIPRVVHQVGGLISLFFSRGPVENGAAAKAADAKRYARYFHGMLRRGIYLPPSPFEAWFLSIVHGDREIQATLQADEEVLQELRGRG